MNLQSIKQRYQIIGNSSALANALQTAVQVAPTELTVLISGESGVGKEVFSKIIHDQSPRKHNPFIAVNCGAIPEGTIDSELFGHEKGAFTGAQSDRKGYFETVNGGSIFLDEVGEMPLGTQARLLRVLESGEFIKVGSSKVQKTDVRIIAATNVNLLEQVKKGKFREDLYYRLNTVPIHIPPLRERKEDIFLLFRKFATDFAEKYRTTPIQLDETARKVLENYRWPGNIRELKNIAEQASVLSEVREIAAEELLKFIPRANEKYLPMIATNKENGGGPVDAAKLFEMMGQMQKDMHQIKELLGIMIQKGYSGGAAQQAAYRLEENNPIVIRHPEQNKNTNEEDEESSSNDSLSLAEMEREYIEKALQKYSGKRKEAAEELGISERTLYRKIKEYGIDY